MCVVCCLWFVVCGLLVGACWLLFVGPLLLCDDCFELLLCGVRWFVVRCLLSVAYCPVNFSLSDVNCALVVVVWCLSFGGWCWLFGWCLVFGGCKKLAFLCCLVLGVYVVRCLLLCVGDCCSLYVVSWWLVVVGRWQLLLVVRCLLRVVRCEGVVVRCVLLVVARWCVLWLVVCCSVIVVRC